MPAAVDVHQHARQRSPRTPLAMHPALASPRHQPRSLQHPFHPAVAERDLVLAAQLLVKMPQVQIEVLVAVQSQHSLHHRHRHFPGGRLAPPPVKQPAKAKLFIALPPAPHVPVADADDLRRLPPGDLLGHGPQNYFLYFHCPLHRGLRVEVHASHGLLPSPPEKRTHHLLSHPDISCANDTPTPTASPSPT